MGNGTDTKDRILDAAERLFAGRGIAGTSLRTVTKEADVNLAAIHYHFGSKNALCHAVLSRRVGPVNRERLRRLDALEALAGDGALRVEDVLEAFIEPVMRLKQDLGEAGAVWSRLIARFSSEPPDLVRELLREQFEDVARRFVRAFARALPHVPPAVVYERFQYVVAVLTQSLSELERFNLLPEYEPGSSDGEAWMRRTYEFLAAGMQAGISGGGSKGKSSR